MFEITDKAITQLFSAFKLSPILSGGICNQGF